MRSNTILFIFPLFLLPLVLSQVTLLKPEWTPCIFAAGNGSLAQTVQTLQDRGYRVSCSSSHVPLDWNQSQNNSAQTINIHVTRVQPPQGVKHTGQFWMLQGGPGGSGESLLSTVELVDLGSLGWTIYLPDHRGTGLSTKLTCELHSQEIGPQYLHNQWGDGIHNFSITSAALDLKYQIQTVAMETGGPVIVYGVSYGTQWLNRLLLIAPDTVDRAIMDGVVHPMLTSVSRYDITANQADPVCSQQFGGMPTPAQTLRNILDQLQDGTNVCSKSLEQEISAEDLRATVFAMMQSGDTYYVRALLPALVFRFNRCNQDDIDVLNYFFFADVSGVVVSLIFKKSWNSRDVLDAPESFSQVLNFNIVLSERYTAPGESVPSVATAEDWYHATISSPNDAQNYAAMYSLWNRYTPAGYYTVVSHFTPVLMLQGQLDPSTPVAQADQLAAITPERSYVKIPLAGHVTSLMAGVGLSCPFDIIITYGMTGKVDSSCISSLPTTIDFAGDTPQVQQVALEYFGTTDLWGVQ